jgi:hypothetical protein
LPQARISNADWHFVLARLLWLTYLSTVVESRGAPLNIKFIPLAAFILVSLPFARNAQGTILGAKEGVAAGETAAEQFAQC